MNCNESFELLYRYLDGDLDGLTAEEVEIHIRICRPCWDRYEFERRLKSRFRESCRHETCPETLRRRILALLEKY